jgi:hypothetical protein
MNFTSDPLGHDEIQVPSWKLNCYTYHIPAIAVLCIMALVGNTITLAAIWKFPELQTRTNMIIASLSSADILVGLSPLFYIYDVVQTICHSPLGQVILKCARNIPYCASVMHLFTTATERYIAISYPLHYEQLLTPRRVKLLIAGTWIVTLLINLMAILPWAGVNSVRDYK